MGRSAPSDLPSPMVLSRAVAFSHIVFNHPRPLRESWARGNLLKSLALIVG